MIDLNNSNQTITKKSSANIALLLVQNGADINIKNKKQQTPLDLSTDLNLNKQLQKQYKELTRSSSSSSQASTTTTTTTTNITIIKNQQDILEECMICSDNKRDTLFKPCNHVVSCYQCSSRCKKCLICKEAIQERIKIDDCLVCSDQKSTVLFEPCGHLCSCDGCALLMKKCVQCRSNIEKCVKFTMCCGELAKEDNGGLSNDSNNCDGNNVEKLKQQLEDIKEQVYKFLGLAKFYYLFLPFILRPCVQFVWIDLKI
jgi:E3 ubiquitin-protein ligase mind-bomb